MLDRAYSLAAILERMQVLYGRVLEILVRERKALVEFDFEFLFEILREKDEVLAALRALDKDRLRIQDYFSIVMERPAEELDLKTLGEAFVSQGADAEVLGRRLLVLRDHLNAVVSALKERVENNRIFTEKSIHNLQEVASHLTQIMSGKNKPGKNKASVYNNKAKAKTGGAASGSIVEKRY